MPAAIRGEGELADTEEYGSEDQGSQGSWQMQKKIGRRIRGARRATWLVCFASLTAVQLLWIGKENVLETRQYHWVF